MRDLYADIEHHATVNLIDVSWSPLEGWVITGVDINKRFRGQGHMKRLLQQVLDDADEKGIPLYLAATSDGTGLSQEDLCGFYESLGFVPYVPDDDPTAYWRPPCPSKHPTNPSN